MPLRKMTNKHPETRMVILKAGISRMDDRRKDKRKGEDRGVGVGEGKKSGYV